MMVCIAVDAILTDGSVAKHSVYIKYHEIYILYLFQPVLLSPPLLKTSSTLLINFIYFN